MWSFFRMHILMDGQTPFFWKCLRTDFAAERFFSSVNSLVNFQCSFERKSFKAELTALAIGRRSSPFLVLLGKVVPENSLFHVVTAAAIEAEPLFRPNLNVPAFPCAYVVLLQICHQVATVVWRTWLLPRKELDSFPAEAFYVCLWFWLLFCVSRFCP